MINHKCRTPCHHGRTDWASFSGDLSRKSSHGNYDTSAYKKAGHDDLHAAFQLGVDSMNKISSPERSIQLRCVGYIYIPSKGPMWVELAISPSVVMAGRFASGVFTLFFLLLLSTDLTVMIRSSPVKVKFEGCMKAAAYGRIWDCCPPTPKNPVVNFKPLLDNSSRKLRIRRALQCLDEEELGVYKEKLERAYNLLAALPGNDPRTLENQAIVHCACGTGALPNDGGRLDVHNGWLFQPWHRWFLYFHERILQGLLGDPTFTIHFWNWDNDGVVVEGRSKGCLKAGNAFPNIYGDPSTIVYHSPRSWRASLPRSPLNLIKPTEDTDLNTWCTGMPDDVLAAGNVKALRDAIIRSTSSDVFFGRKYSAGDFPVDIHQPNATGEGSLERPHDSVHAWVGGDMLINPISSLDPVFWAHHGNVERLWDMWQRLGPNRTVPQDPDFLDAEFLFYDENGDTVRVTVRDSLDTRALGYIYEETNDASWNYNSMSNGPDGGGSAGFFEEVVGSEDL
ncbi:hypothetical protein R1sor_021565 [Riccia sorocarpa]|uniref:Tyrosinase copper-binding domain-containing protein n=1 Tax=Riccia sorocarpa TaxID=122646 RepID=A0ABD3GLM9_9MARC